MEKERKGKGKMWEDVSDSSPSRKGNYGGFEGDEISNAVEEKMMIHIGEIKEFCDKNGKKSKGNFSGKNSAIDDFTDYPGVGNVLHNLKNFNIDVEEDVEDMTEDYGDKVKDMGESFTLEAKEEKTKEDRTCRYVDPATFAKPVDFESEEVDPATFSNPVPFESEEDDGNKVDDTGESLEVEISDEKEENNEKENTNGNEAKEEKSKEDTNCPHVDPNNPMDVESKEIHDLVGGKELPNMELEDEVMDEDEVKGDSTTKGRDGIKEREKSSEGPEKDKKAEDDDKLTQLNSTALVREERQGTFKKPSTSGGDLIAVREGQEMEDKDMLNEKRSSRTENCDNEISDKENNDMEIQGGDNIPVQQCGQKRAVEVAE
ncbi:unnamed protein product [Arabis nemorensis]|uniref:Uncharacterized protein n=1 Tax=Arabis nemorensis TaxID=586526 RepID=A0A565BN03_9BRAS|nr:unnamed protein product [Arabis nemorensis]